MFSTDTDYQRAMLESAIGFWRSVARQACDLETILYAERQYMDRHEKLTQLLTLET